MSDRTVALPTWDLSDLYDGMDDPALEADLKRIEADATAFETRFKGTIASAQLTAAHLRDVLDAYSALVTDHYKPGSYASLLYSTDTTDPARGALLQKTREFDSTITTHLVFFDIEIGLIPDTVYDVAVADESLAPFRHYLDHQRQLAAHNLSEAEEKVLVETANSRGRAFARLATEVNTRTRFTVQLEGQGEEEKTQSEILPLLYDPVRETRRRAAAALSRGLEANRHVGTFIYNTLLHEKDVLVADYYRLKARLLQLPELTHYDRYAPITSMETPFSFERGREIALAAFTEFSPRLAEIAEPFFSRRWIDAALADGKRGGAYCAGITPDHHPYVFLNYTGRPRDVMTLAHELGHGVHDVLASRNHVLDYHPVLPMAETASTFAEMLVFERLHAELSSPEEQLALLCSKTEDTFATVFRQIAMYRFEQSAHRERRRDGELPSERFDELWQSHIQEMFGDSVQLGDENGCWWLYIPHIVDVPFYVYAYAFGELLVMALYARYRAEGAPFVERYFELLASGGARSPKQLVAAMGMDIGDRMFWQEGCNLIRGRVSEAFALSGKPSQTKED